MELTIALCGDIMPGAEVAERMGSALIADWLEGVSKVWQEADLVIGNLECPCVVRAKPTEGPLPEIIFHADVKRLVELARCGVLSGHTRKQSCPGLRTGRVIRNDAGSRQSRYSSRWGRYESCRGSSASINTRTRSTRWTRGILLRSTRQPI